MKLELTSDQLVAIYRGSNIQSRKAIKEALGDKFSTELPIQERIKTFEDAMAELGDEHPAVRSYNSVKYGYAADKEPDIMAYLKLRIITTALNEGWTPQFTEGERRWYAWYDLLDKEDLDGMTEEEKKERRVVGRASGNACASGGLVCSHASNVSTYSSAVSGSRLAFKSEELAEYAGKQFIEIYADFCFIPEQSKA